MTKLTEADVRRLAKEAAKEKTSHSVRGITVTHRKVVRDASGRFVALPPESKSRRASKSA